MQMHLNNNQRRSFSRIKIVTTMSILCISLLCFAQIFFTEASAATRPYPPTGLTATAGNTQVVLTWIAPTNDGGSPIVNYQVFKGTTSNGEFWIANVSASLLTYTATGLTNGQIYYFYVEAINVMGSSAPSTEVNATPASQPITVPGAPTDLTATAGNAQVVLNWIAPANDGGSPIVNYQVFKGTTPNGESWLANVSASLLTFTATGLTNGQIYYFYVEAINVMGSSAPSTEVNATPASQPITVPGAPTDLTATAGNAQVVLNWIAPANDGGSPIVNYQVFKGTTPNGESWLANVSASLLTFTATGLTNGQIYYFYVEAINVMGSSAPSTEVNATPASQPITVPGAPTDLTATAGNAQVVLNWIAPANAGGSPIVNYQVFKGTTPNGESWLANVSASLLTFTATGLTNGQIYYFYVTAINVMGSSAPSAEVNATPVAPINQPPVASFTYTPSSPVVGQSVQFTDTSTDPDGTIAAWQWNFGDGTANSTIQNPTHAFSTAGTCTVTLTVTDNGGASGKTQKSVTIAQPYMYVQAISMSCTKTQSNYNIYTTVTAYNWAGTALSGVSVTIQLKTPSGTKYTLTGTTGSDGKVTLMKSCSKTRGTYTSTVTNLVKTGWVYNPSKNVMTSQSLVVS